MDAGKLPHHSESTSVNHAQRMVTRQDRSYLDGGRTGYTIAATPARPAIVKMRSQETGSQAETIRIVRGPINRNSYEYHYSRKRRNMA